MRYRSVESPADPTFYLPITQNARTLAVPVVHGLERRRPRRAAIGRCATRFAQADPQQAVTRVRSYDEILRTALAARRFNTTAGRGVRRARRCCSPRSAPTA